MIATFRDEEKKGFLRVLGAPCSVEEKRLTYFYVISTGFYTMLW